MGDPAGIGPEVVLKSVAAFARRGDAPEFVVIGDLAAMREAAAQIDESPPLVEWHPGEALPSNGLAVLPLTELSRAARRPVSRASKAATHLFATSRRVRGWRAMAPWMRW